MQFMSKWEEDYTLLAVEMGSGTAAGTALWVLGSTKPALISTRTDYETIFHL
jgi:hypothetical protein